MMSFPTWTSKSSYLLRTGLKEETSCLHSFTRIRIMEFQFSLRPKISTKTGRKRDIPCIIGYLAESASPPGRTVMSGHSLCCLIVASASAAIVLQAAPAPQFGRDIRPILQKHCVGCHSGASAQASLDLRSRESLLKGGISGPAIAPGSAERSPL